MTAMEYPFLGRFKNVEETHGHGSAKKNIPTNLQFRVSGENLTVEEVHSTSEHMESILQQKGRHGHAPLPDHGISIPGDGRTYFISTKVEHRDAKHFCKLELQGKPARHPVTGPVIERESTPQFVVCQAKQGDDEENTLIKCGDKTHKLALGSDTMLDLSTGGPLKILLPKPKKVYIDGPSPPTPPPPPPPPKVISLPKIDVSIGSVTRDKTVTFAVSLLGGALNRVQLSSGALVDQGHGRASLVLDATRANPVDIVVFGLDDHQSVPQLQQQMVIPVLEKDIPATPSVELRVEDTDDGRTLVAPAASGATVHTFEGDHSGSTAGIPGLKLDHGKSVHLEVKQNDGAAARIHLDDRAFSWIQPLRDAIGAAGDPSPAAGNAQPAADSAAIAAKIKDIRHTDPDSSGARICRYMSQLLTDTPPTLSLALDETGTKLTGIKCDGGAAVTAVVGAEAPCWLTAGSSVPFPQTDAPSKSLAFSVQRGARDLTRVVLENHWSGPAPPPPPPAERPVLELAASTPEDIHVNFGNGSNELLSARTGPIKVPLDAKQLSIAPAHKGVDPPPPVKPKSQFLPNILNVYRKEEREKYPQQPDALSLKQGWAGVPYDNEADGEKDTLDMLQALLDHILKLTTKPTTGTANFQLAVGDGRIHSIACPPFKVLAAVDDLPAAPVDVTGCVPPTGTFAPGSQHIVTLTAVDEKEKPVSTLSLRVPVHENSPGPIGVGPDELDFSLQRLESKTRVRLSVPSGFKLQCTELDGQPLTVVGTDGTCIIDVDPDLSHKCTVVATSGALSVFKQVITIPRLSLPNMTVHVDGFDLRIAEQEGVIYSYSDNDSQEVVGNRHSLAPDTPHNIQIRQFLTGVSMTKTGEHHLRLPPFVDYEAIVELVSIMSEAGMSPWTRLVQRLMRLHGRTKSDRIKELITLLISKLLNNETEDRLEDWYQKVMEAVSNVKVSSKDKQNSVLFFRLKGNDPSSHY